MRSENRFSLSRLCAAICQRGTAVGVELETSGQLERELSPKFKERIGGIGTLVPGSAFNPPGFRTRDLTTGTGAALIGTRVERLNGAIGFSSVVKRGGLVLGPYTADNLRIYYEQALPSASWVAEAGAVLAADLPLSSATLSPRRICSSICVSKQLLLQSAGVPSFDVYLATKMGVALSSLVDQAVLYGQGAAQNQPTGVINTAGTTAVTVGVPPVWADLEALRLAATNQNADLSTFAYISSQTVRKSLATSARFTGGGSSIYDGCAGAIEISREASDNRIFAGCWGYATICYWGVGENGPAIDVIVDPFSRGHLSEVILTSAAYVDTCAVWPSLFAYSQPNVAS